MFRNLAPWVCLTLLFALAGCARKDYRIRADFDAYSAIQEKSRLTPWEPSSSFSVYPAPGSRLVNDGPLDDPLLPDPAPKLYQYQIPDFGRDGKSTTPDTNDQMAELGRATESEIDKPEIAPIPPDAWLNIPINCRRRMFDFASLRQEATLTDERFGSDVTRSGDSAAPALALPDIIELAILNSRDYQTQKETLYRAALQLSVERFDYQLKPTARGNGSDLAYAHSRDGGLTVNNLGIPTTVGVEKALVTGGDLLARFANSILLTFNGPSGFAADVSSDLLLDISQPLLQRDIRFEGLTQAERNTVYAARDYARFRKAFFTDFASRYYALIRDFRQIEILSQNYFSLVRAFNQAEAEYRAGLVPRVQVDQVEQNLLRGRGQLIGACNRLEQSLDSFKLEIGLPTETPINVDLTELNELTQSDQLAVSGELIQRSQRRLESALTDPNPIELLSTGVVLIDRILDASRLQEQETGSQRIPVEAFRERRSRMLVESSRLTALEITRGLDTEIKSDSPSLPVIFQRTIGLINNLLELTSRQLELANLMGVGDIELEPARGRRETLAAETERLQMLLQEMIRDEQLQQLPDLVRQATTLRTEAEQLVRDADRLSGVDEAVSTTEQVLEQALQLAEDVMAQSQEVSELVTGGLIPVEIDVDDAMITALALRFDLMNQRGRVADAWRRIKFAGDDLRSILDVDASQRISTRTDINSPFAFTFDESRTDLRLTFDAPLNRRIERNQYRDSLISYQAQLRDLMEAEDFIKFSVRNDLRNLALDREQYVISVAQAALAFERVVSTSLEFRLGTGGVSARDFLEAQTAYTDALSDVASQHIQYIVDRTQLFLDLELLTVDEQGFWVELYDESFQPQSYFEIPNWGAPVYGDLPGVRYSKDIRRMLGVEPGPTILGPSD